MNLSWKMIFVAVVAAVDAVISAAPVGLKPDGVTVPTHTELQKAFLKLPRTERRQAFADGDYRRRLAKGTSRPEPVTLEWTGSGKALLTVRRKTDGRVVFTDDAALSPVKLSNLEIGCEYEWSVKDQFGESRATFRTEDEPPRLLDAGLVPNVRDLGGYLGLDGRRVRQNRVFRTAGLNSNASKEKASDDEVKKADPDGVIDRMNERLAPRLAAYREMEEKPALMNVLSLKLPAKWKIARLPGEMRSLQAAVLFAAGRAPEPDGEIAADSRGKFRLGKGGANDWSWLSCTLTAPEDGFYAVEISADWYWAVAVDGEVVACRLAGNGRVANGPGHIVPLPLKKGDNTVSAIVGAGKDGYFFRITADTETPRAQLAACAYRYLKTVPVDLLSNPDRYVTGKTRIDAANRELFLKTLGIRSDIDLRSGGECYGMTGSPLGKSVKWFHYSSSAYAGMSSQSGRSAFAKVFKVFLNEKNYPIVFHCIAGQDRTGAVSYILLSLLGVEDEFLWKDWEATGFHNSSIRFVHAQRFDKLLRVFSEYPGATNRERVEAYVKSLGFTDADIAKFRELMLEPVRR